MYGEKLFQSPLLRLPLGSPPHVRGKVFEQVYTRIPFRITPARAGKSGAYLHAPTLCQDHPRACGEKALFQLSVLNALGSPPHVRGKVCAAGECNLKAGITPAYAGKRESLSRCSSFTWDHPRVCGEKSFSWMWAMASRGSPPRVRGKDVFGIFGNVGGGITPACAGKSQRRGFQGFSRKDHPRVCGEKPARHSS